MRRATHNEGIITTEKGELLGVSLGFDFCAEHEWGTERLRAAFGIPKTTRENAGIESRTITVVPHDQHDPRYSYGVDEKTLTIGYPIGNAIVMWQKQEPFKDWGDFSKKCKNCKPGQGVKNWTPKSIPNEQRCGYHRNPASEKDMVAAWDESSFGIRFNPMKKAEFEEMNKAILEKRVALAYYGGRSKNPFENASLCLVIIERLPQDFLERQKAADLDHFDLTEAAEATGVQKLIEEKVKVSHGKPYYALSPKWAKEFTGMQERTKHSVVFWLNPADQEKNASNWFTVEELEAWTRGEGPVIKANQEKTQLHLAQPS